VITSDACAALERYERPHASPQVALSWLETWSRHHRSGRTRLGVLQKHPRVPQCELGVAIFLYWACLAFCADQSGAVGNVGTKR
jgi:hypothetical protein